MSDLPLLIRLLVALTPKVTLHISTGITRDVSLEKVINVGKEKMSAKIRKQLKRHDDIHGSEG